jgi:hypothetical protein
MHGGDHEHDERHGIYGIHCAATSSGEKMVTASAARARSACRPSRTCRQNAWGGAQLRSEAAGFKAAEAFPTLGSKTLLGAEARDSMLVGFLLGV